MPDVFSDYANYYDLFYKDKDYAGEAAYIHSLIQKHHSGAKTVLNLGCGTGKHDACLEQLGYKITGVDQSDSMLVQAHKRAIPGKLEFFKGDVRTIELGKKADVVISLFHVMSYQITDKDVLAAFRTAAYHLKDGGIFIFDFWHGEGVLNDPPVVKVKRFEGSDSKVVRIAEPVMHPERHVVDVNYQILALDKQSGRYNELYETHSMRYFFLPEVKCLLARKGFLLMDAHSWMSEKPLISEWYGLAIASKERGT